LKVSTATETVYKLQRVFHSENGAFCFGLVAGFSQCQRYVLTLM